MEKNLTNSRLDRQNILNNCETKDERTRTDQIIRPVLRGRDIKRNGYEWAGLYCICTFPAKHLQIDEYASIRDYFESACWSEEIPNNYGKMKLEQTGQSHTIDGIKFKSRKKTSNAWFETQDTIAYMDDFKMQRFVWTAVNSEYRFVALDKEIYYNNSIFHGISDKAIGIASIMNSTIMCFYLMLLSSSDYQYGGKELMQMIPIPIKIKNITYTDNSVQKLYHLTDEEMNFISSSVK